MPIAHGLAANFPRWKHEGTALYADRIYSVDSGVIFLECGARVDATDDLMSTGPARYGDFLTIVPDENGMPNGDMKLVAGADFQTAAMPIPHALDIAQVSPDVQPGFKSTEPTSGSPDDPAAVTAEDAAKAAAADPVATSEETHAAANDGAGEKPNAGG